MIKMILGGTLFFVGGALPLIFGFLNGIVLMAMILLILGAFLMVQFLINEA